MPDFLSKAQRSKHMSLVRSRDTRFELAFLRVLSAEVYPCGFRYRKHHRTIPGTPDIVFLKYRLAVFLDSDFWHGRNYAKLADRMNQFWRRKIERNMERDRQVNRALRRDGWTVLRLGEKEVKKDALRAACRIGGILATLRGGTTAANALGSKRALPIIRPIRHR